MKPPLPLLRWASASLPKHGNPPAENEDAVAADAAGSRFAVADGASESWQSGEWAAHLAAAFVGRPPGPADFPAWLSATRLAWQPPVPKEAVAWYAEAKREEGSFATLLGVAFECSERSGGWVWKAVAVGDSCLVRVRGGRVVESFPVTAADTFDRNPPLVCSSATRPCPNPEWLAGRAEPGDVFVLATDAAAASLLAGTDAAWRPLLVTPPAVPTWPDRKRLLELLGKLSPALNDDASVVQIAVPTRPESPP